MKKITDSDLELIQNYLHANIEECIYLYIDIRKYGIGHPEVTFWFTEKEGKPDTVLMKYYDSFQIFSANEDWNLEETVELIKKFQVMTICGKRSMIEALSEKLNGYSVAYGVIVREGAYREFKQFSSITKAVPKDAMKIAELMCSDEEFNENYEVDVLAKQLEDRMREGVGRSYVLWEDEKIVAHIGVFAEDEEIAVDSGLIVDEAYKSKFYGMIIHEYLKKQLILEGKRVYGFRIKDSMKRCTKASGDNVCGEYGKMTWRNENEK